MAKRARSMKRAAKVEKDVSFIQKSIDISYKIPTDAVLLYADQYTVQFYTDEFVISFFQTEHPLVFSGEEFQQREALDARCVARFVLNPNQMGRFVMAVNKNFQRWREVHSSEENEK